MRHLAVFGIIFCLALFSAPRAEAKLTIGAGFLYVIPNDTNDNANPLRGMAPLRNRLKTLHLKNRTPIARAFGRPIAASTGAWRWSPEST